MVVGFVPAFSTHAPLLTLTKYSFDSHFRKQEAAAAAELESLRQSDPLNYPRPPPPIPEEEPQPEPMPDAVFDVPDTMYPEVRCAMCVLSQCVRYANYFKAPWTSFSMLIYVRHPIRSECRFGSLPS